MKQIRSRVLTGSIGLEGAWSEWIDFDPRIKSMVQLMQNREYEVRDVPDELECPPPPTEEQLEGWDKEMTGECRRPKDNEEWATGSGRCYDRGTRGLRKSYDGRRWILRDRKPKVRCFKHPKLNYVIRYEGENCVERWDKGIEQDISRTISLSDVLGNGNLVEFPPDQWDDEIENTNPKPKTRPWGKAEWERAGMVRSATGQALAVLHVSDHSVKIYTRGWYVFSVAAETFTPITGGKCEVEV